MVTALLGVYLRRYTISVNKNVILNPQVHVSQPSLIFIFVRKCNINQIHCSGREKFYWKIQFPVCIFFTLTMIKIMMIIVIGSTNSSVGHAVAYMVEALLQVGKLRVRVPMRSFNFFNLRNPSVAPWPWWLLSYNRNEHQKIFLMGKRSYHLCADYVDNVEFLRTHNPIGLQGLLQG
jgi:hypothetical protein